MKKIISAIFFLAILASPCTISGPALADNYSVGFDSAHIKINSPRTSNIECSGSISIEGSSDLQEVWFCIRSPHKELTTAKAEVKNGSFKTNLNLRMGSGEYTIWAGDNSTHFDGSIRFLVENKSEEDARYTAASLYVDYENPHISELARSLTLNQVDDMAKLKCIHDWITANISYDWESYRKGENKMIPASDTLASKKGMCRDYAFLMAALSRSAGLPARVVYGEASPRANSSKELHAWNEVLIYGKWIPVDSCWDAGYVVEARFIASPSSKFFNPDQNLLTATHNATTAALY